MHTSLMLAGSGIGVTSTELRTAIAALLVGVVVGITGMGGGALMTPALIFLGVGNPTAVVTADLASSAVSRSTGAIVHWRHGSPHFRLAGLLILGSVPCAFLGPPLLQWFSGGSDIENVLQICIGLALLFAAVAYAFRLYILLRHRASGRTAPEGEPQIRALPTILVGMLGGLLVGITSVGAGSVIMIALLLLYPTLSAIKLVGTDLVQAVPLVLAAAISNVLTHGLDWSITIPLIIGSVPGTFVGARIAPRVPQSVIRRAIVIVLTMSGLALLDKSGWLPVGTPGQTHPVFIALTGLVLVILMPFVWGLLRRGVGLPMFGTPTVAQIEGLDRSTVPPTAGQVASTQPSGPTTAADPSPADGHPEPARIESQIGDPDCR
ncbi:MAG: sulfite exporter TauE/SafE family protein [Nocardioidaceae bacterium]